jgi:ElaB/YqjD/DUF883 family membrane-anchored ribosome-binding protein/uncharacterized protein YjbJ (UPF0337 family)
MNLPKFETEWEGFQGHVAVKWDKISNEELLRIQGNFTELITLISEKYGETKDSAEKKLKESYDTYLARKDELKKEFTELRDNLQQKSEALTEKIRQQATDFQKNAKERIQKINDENIQPAVEKSEEYIKLHPFTAVLGALGVGFILGSIFAAISKKD